MKEKLLDYLIRVNQHKDTVITAFEDNGKITIWQEFNWPVDTAIHLMDKNLDEKERHGKVWRLFRFNLNGFSADKITWEESTKTYYKRVGEQYKYQSPRISWEGGIIDLVQVSELLNNSVFRPLEPGQFDRYFKKYLFGLVMMQPDQAQLNAKFYLSKFLDI